MQNTLLIIGNGFDVACGLKSRYSDFFDACIQGKYGMIDIGHMLRKSMFPPKNFWQNLLLVYAWNVGTNDYFWCNIEDIIQKTLYQINNGIPNSDYHSALYYRAWCAKASEDFEQILEDPIIKHILIYLHKWISHFQNTNYRMSSKEEVRDVVNSYLLQELQGFEKQFCEYLKSQITEEYLKKANELRDKLFLPIRNSSSNTNPIYLQLVRQAGIDTASIKEKSILSFNYTSQKADDIRYYNVHGKLCDTDCDKNCVGSSVIFGIDDSVVKKYAIQELKLFSKTYRKLFLENPDTSILPLKMDSISIKFFGHSLNEADYSYFQSIFDYYDIYSNALSDLVFYYSPYREDEKKSVTDAVYRLMNQYGATLSNKDQGKNLMHKLLLENRITIREITL